MGADEGDSGSVLGGLIGKFLLCRGVRTRRVYAYMANLVSASEFTTPSMVGAVGSKDRPPGPASGKVAIVIQMRSDVTEFEYSSHISF